MKRYRQKPYRPKTQTPFIKIAGLLSIIFGSILLFIPSVINQKISTSFIFVGIIVILMLTENRTTWSINSKELILIFIILTWIVLMITINADFELYILFITIGIFIIKEFLSEFLEVILQKRLNIIYYTSIIFFFLIAIKTIINL